jgi:hypothetical protein
MKIIDVFDMLRKLLVRLDSTQTRVFYVINSPCIATFCALQNAFLVRNRIDRDVQKSVSPGDHVHSLLNAAYLV